MSDLELRFSAPVGPASAPLLVLGPSLGTSTIVWARAIPLLAERFKVIAWDLPGHGSSPVVDHGFTVGELADAVVAGLDGDEPFIAAGVSLGGATSLEIALAHPGRVLAVGAVCTGAAIGSPEAWRSRAELVRESGTLAVLPGSRDRWFAPDTITRLPDDAAALLRSLLEADDESYAKCCEALATYDVRDRLGEIGVPVLALWGEHDQVTPESSALEIAAGVQRGTTVRVAGAGHLAPAEQWDAVAAAIGALAG